MAFIRKILKENFLPFFYTSALFCSGYLGYITIKMNRNNKNFENLKNNEDFKDTTRLGYDFYGLNWGVASDNMVTISF